MPYNIIITPIAFIIIIAQLFALVSCLFNDDI